MSATEERPRNVDDAVVQDFGREWDHFDQGEVSDAESRSTFESYFSIFPWQLLGANATGFDAGCGSGRWAKHVATRVGRLHLIDPSTAIEVARRNLGSFTNCCFHQATVDELPFPDESMDFGYSLGVLHHLPDTARGLEACTRKLKPGAPFLVYLYYAFDNRPVWFRALWRVSDVIRRFTSRLPFGAKLSLSHPIALFVYWPLARVAGLLERAGMDVSNFPLSGYRDKSLYTMRTDSLDRFGTKLERRFSRAEIEHMMRAAGLDAVRFSETTPFWCAVGIKR